MKQSAVEGFETIIDGVPRRMGAIFDAGEEVMKDVEGCPKCALHTE